MSDAVVAQHPPAIMVGGRRLSVTSRPRPRANSGALPNVGANQTENTDYPRPAGHGDEEAHDPPHNEEELPKKKKHHGHGSHDDNRLQESAYRKAEASRPTKDNVGGKSGYGASGRIAQPAGKSFGI
ncbi:uncharacterized protein EDB91DRAFT_291767 [Suillus paluster]|uniref:uncharacterized protein n=1 Tax=Suillus paluster TaxID=48578 RepID=UPI001B85EFE6|nr:uncharacterized protein EDB91DRAFT_291767 [Suillus paluster]KAG1742688.1 hypothetical protein EDB91DRAFT_291767 [Suillus paluster]